MASTKFQGNRFKINGEIAENHAIHGMAMVMVMVMDMPMVQPVDHNYLTASRLTLYKLN